MTTQIDSRVKNRFTGSDTSARIVRLPYTQTDTYICIDTHTQIVYVHIHTYIITPPTHANGHGSIYFPSLVLNSHPDVSVVPAFNHWRAFSSALASPSLMSLSPPTSKPMSLLLSLSATANNCSFCRTLQSSLQIHSCIYQNTVISVTELYLITGALMESPAIFTQKCV